MRRKYLYGLAGLFLFLGVAGLIWDIWGRGYVVFNPQPAEESASRYREWNDCRRVFDTGTEKLEGWFLEKKGTPLLVFCAGRGRDAGSYLKTFDSCPVAKLLINYRGSGTSTGNPSETVVVNDIICAVETVLRESGRSWEHVVLVGNSLGAGVAIHIASQRSVGRLILCVPFENFEACASEFAPGCIISLLFDGTFRSDLHAPGIKSPVFILAATHDRDVPVEQARRLSERFESVLYREFPAGHESLWSVPSFRNELCRDICGFNVEY